MNEATALAEAKHPGALHRRGQARDPDDRLFGRIVHDLEAIQPLQRLHGDTSLHADT